MPFYEYVAVDKIDEDWKTLAPEDRMEVLKRGDEAPPFGHELRTHDGRTFRRVPSLPEAKPDEDRYFASMSLPDGYKYHRMAGGTFDERGRCAFTSRKQIRETVAVANDHGEELTYDG